jgi:hypothetical protein
VRCMERHNRPPPLAIPQNPPAYLSVLSYTRTPSSYGLTYPEMPAWASSRRRNLRRTVGACGGTAGTMFIALMLVTATLVWLLVRGADNVSSPLSQMTDSASAATLTRKRPDQVPARVNLDNPDIVNSTLNFQKIFAINLPSRLDRKDTLTLMAAYANLSITIVPGVRSIAENSLPPPRTPGAVRTEEYQVWRAHANIWRKIIEDGLTTALILEDDNDWDLNIKEQIPRIMNALDEIRRPPLREEEEGVVRGGREREQWDILYLGTCMELAAGDKQTPHGHQTFIPIPSDHDNVASHNYNWVRPVGGTNSRWRISFVHFNNYPLQHEFCNVRISHNAPMPTPSPPAAHVNYCSTRLSTSRNDLTSQWQNWW